MNYKLLSVKMLIKLILEYFYFYYTSAWYFKTLTLIDFLWHHHSSVLMPTGYNITKPAGTYSNAQPSCLPRDGPCKHLCQDSTPFCRIPTATFSFRLSILLT